MFSEDNSYTQNKDDSIIGILYGKTFPFPKDQFLKALEEINAKYFIIAIIDTGEKLDLENFMFNTMQRKIVLEKALEEKGLEGQVILLEKGLKLSQAFEFCAQEASKFCGKNIRPVFCFDKTREEDVSSLFIKFDHIPQSSLEKSKYEYIIDYDIDRKLNLKSREDLRSNDKQQFAQDSGYSYALTKLIFDWWEINKSLIEKNQVFNATKGKLKLPKLEDLDLNEFYDFINYVDQNAGKITFDTFSIVEKLDGESIFIGYDSFGFYLGYPESDNKFRRLEDLNSRYWGLFEASTSSELPEILKHWKERENCEDLKVQLEFVSDSTSKIIKYSKDLIGEQGFYLCVQALADAEVARYQEEIFIELQACLASEHLECTNNTLIDFIPIDIDQEIETLSEALEYIEDDEELEAELATIKSEIRKKILKNFTQGLYGNDFEGLILKALDDSSIHFKVLSDKYTDLANLDQNLAKSTNLTEMTMSGGFQAMAPANTINVSYLNKKLKSVNKRSSKNKILKENTKFKTHEIDFTKMVNFQFDQFISDLKDFFKIISNNIGDATDTEIGETQVILSIPYADIIKVYPKLESLVVQIPANPETVLKLHDFLVYCGQTEKFTIVKNNCSSQDSNIIMTSFIRYHGFNPEAIEYFGLDLIEINWLYIEQDSTWYKNILYEDWEDLKNNIPFTTRLTLLDTALQYFTDRSNCSFVTNETKKQRLAPENTSEFSLDPEKGVLINLIPESETVYAVPQEKIYNQDWNFITSNISSISLEDSLSFTLLCKSLNNNLEKSQLQDIFEIFVISLVEGNKKDTEQNQIIVDKMTELFSKLDKEDCKLFYQACIS